MALRLGFHYHIPMLRDSHGSLRTPGYLGRFLDSLAQHCDTLVCFAHSPRPDEADYMDYPLQSTNIEWVDMGAHCSVPRRALRAHALTQPVREWRARLDALLIRGPSPLLPAMARAAGDLPVALLLVGDYMAGIDDLPQPLWRKEAIRLWASWNQRQQLKVTRKTLTFVNSRKLYDQLQPHAPSLVETRTTTLSVNDFFEREDTCLQRPIRLLYTGRMDRTKGLIHMVEALDHLVREGEDVVLNLVGWPQKGDPILDEIRQLAEARGIAERIQYHGFTPVGPALFEHYKQADIYVLASTHEGFPRTIWEAMAHSVPVIATRVGSIPLFLQHEQTALLVEPRSVRQLVEAIRRIISDRDTRLRLIQNGRSLAVENTLDRRALEMISFLEKWVAEHQGI